MNAHYIIYIKSIIRLAGSLVLKSAKTAALLNERLSVFGVPVDPNDPYTWKYYLNLSGRYHSVDEMMSVTSLDDLSEIEFTVENLAIHTATREAYLYGSEYYNALLARYPRQQALIKGILNPLDIDHAIDAPDHTILFHDASLVESNEQYLIPALQKFTDLYFNNWYNRDYDLFEPRNYPAVLGNYYTKLVIEIIALRKRACKTDNAHSFHVRQYLSSFSPVGREFDYMTEKQRLWLYRNIRYLNRNIGRKELFKELVQRFMTDRGFSLVGYEFDHDYSALTETLVPEVELRRIQINAIPPAMGGKTSTVGEILDKEAVLAPGNEIIRDDTEISATERSRRMLSARAVTKVLESSVLDKTDSEPYTLADTLLNHWAYLSHSGRYNAVVSFINPGNGSEETLRVKDAFILFLYAYNRGIGIDLEYVPVISVNRVQRLPLPTWTELRTMGDRKKVPDVYIEHILDKLPVIGSYVSVSTFRSKCRDIQRTMAYFREMRHLNGDYIAEGMLHGMIDRCYMDARVDLAGGMRYSDWLFEKGIDTEAMGQTEFGIVAQELFKAATGADVSEADGFKAIHAAMIRIMQALSSYSVHYLAEINDSPMKVLDSKFPKLTVPEFDTVQGVEIELPQHRQEVNVEEFCATLPSVSVQVGRMAVSDELIAYHLPAQVGIVYRGMGIGETSVRLPAPQISIPTQEPMDLSTLSDGSTYGYDPIIAAPVTDYITTHEVDGYAPISDARRRLFLGL